MNGITLILLEAALETVPPSISNHPAVIKTAARRGKKPIEILLDASLHYHAMRKLPNASKRGRPDIVHVSLLEALESPLCKKGFLQVAIYTIEGHAVLLDPATRLPKNYNRFVGLMEQLFKLGQVPPNAPKPLLRLKTIKLSELLEELSVRGLILLDENCEYRSLNSIVRQASSERLAIGVGAFPHGNFDESTRQAASYCYSIYKEPLTTHVVVSRVLASAENMLGLLEL